MSRSKMAETRPLQNKGADLPIFQQRQKKSFNRAFCSNFSGPAPLMLDN